MPSASSMSCGSFTKAVASESYSPPCGTGSQPQPAVPFPWVTFSFSFSLMRSAPSRGPCAPARPPSAADAVLREPPARPGPAHAAATYSPKASSASGAKVRPPSQSISEATHCSASSGRSGIGATAPMAQRTPRRAGSRTRPTDATARPGPVRPVAFRNTCGACSSGTRTKPISSPGRSISRPASRYDTGISRCPPGPTMTRTASSAASTGSASPVGAAVAMLPPRVPALRICGGRRPGPRPPGRGSERRNPAVPSVRA